MTKLNILLVTYPGQGNINPCLQFAKRLLKLGATVTFLLSSSAPNRMSKTSPTPQGLTFATFDDGVQPGADILHQMSQLSIHGSKAVAELITENSRKGQPFTRLVYTQIITWAAQVAQQLDIPTTLLWLQPATVFDIYYFYFNGFAHVFSRNCSIELPGLPQLTVNDLPSFFMFPSTSNVSTLEKYKVHFDILEKDPTVLVNTFDALEFNPLRAAAEKLNLIPVGPLIPSAFLDGKDPLADSSFEVDDLGDHIEWLNLNDESSVVYVSFGSYLNVSELQMEEMARGLLESNRPFLWVVRETEEKKLWSREKLEEKGKIVSWCSQVEVLSHPCVGCFVTHCGWNSSLESLASGVPVVAFPLWTDQATNAKLMVDVCRTGVRVVTNKEGIVEGNEIKRCIDMVMGDGEGGNELRKNAENWKQLARESVKEGGSSYMNLNAFVNEIGGCC